MGSSMIRIGYPSGYWGDDQAAPSRMLESAADLDYLAMDYLAEITMAILKRQQDRDETLGYARDFPALVGEILEDLVDQDVTLLANAGGVNPESCKDAVVEVAANADADVSVAAVAGDEILERIPDLREQGIEFDNMDTGQSFETVADDLVAANAYLGSFPIAEALDEGADIVVTGRCVDAALAIGPMIHEFGWNPDQYDNLASGLVAGHLLECGAQVTGGVFLDDWEDVDFMEMGYPIVEMDADGEFVVTKPDGAGGLVNEATVKEQLVYEIKDPNAYQTPDVTADFTTPQLDRVGENRVRVTGCEGEAPPESLKVSALYRDGYKAQLLLTYSWPDALKKAERADDVIRKRLDRDGVDLREIRTEYVGYDGCHDGISPRPADPNEIVLRIAVKADQQDAIDSFGKTAIPISIAGPPNVTPLVSGRPNSEPVLSFWPCTIPRDAVEPTLTVESTEAN
jgi:hypothetical protein